MRLSVALASWLREHPVGEVYAAPLDVILSDVDVVEPDLLFVSNERRDDARQVDPRRARPRRRDPLAGHAPRGRSHEAARSTSVSACASTGLWTAKSRS